MMMTGATSKVHGILRLRCTRVCVCGARGRVQESTTLSLFLAGDDAGAWSVLKILFGIDDPRVILVGWRRWRLERPQNSRSWRPSCGFRRVAGAGEWSVPRIVVVIDHLLAVFGRRRRRRRRMERPETSLRNDGSATATPSRPYLAAPHRAHTAQDLHRTAYAAAATPPM